MKKLFNFRLLVLIGVLIMSVSQMWGTGTKRIYCEYSGVSSWWGTVYIYAWGGGKSAKKYTAEATGTANLVRCDIDDYHTDLLFYKSNSQDGSWETQSVDVSIGSNNRWSLGDGGYGNKGTISNQQRYAPGTAIDGLLDIKNPHNQMFTNGKCSVELAAHQTYEFKILETSTLYGLNDLIATSSISNQTLNTSGYQVRLCTASAGTYIFAYNTSNHQLSITYPTVTKHPSIDYCYVIDYSWSPSSNLYLWNGTSTKVAEWDGSSTIAGSTWPGPAISASAKATINSTSYFYIAPGEFEYFMVSKNGDDGDRTGEVQPTYGKYRSWTSGDGWQWRVFNFTITLDEQAVCVSAPSDPDVEFFGTALSNSAGAVTIPVRTGYTFGGYYNTSACNDLQIISNTGAWQGSKTGYTNSDRQWIHEGGTATLYAKWTEDTHDVSVAYKYNGESIKSSGTVSSVGIATSQSVTAPDIDGYVFTGWSAMPSGVTTSGELTDKTISINATADDKTITANYTVKYAMYGSLDSDASDGAGMSGWSVADNFTYSAGTYTLVLNLTKPNEVYKFRVLDHDGNVSYGLAVKAVIPENTATALNSTNADAQLATAGRGNYTFTVVEYGGYPKITISNPTSYLVTLGVKSVNDDGSDAGDLGGAVTATDAAGNTYASGSYIASGETVTVTAGSIPTGYHFVGWWNSSAYSSGAFSTENPDSWTVDGAVNAYVKFIEDTNTFRAASGSNWSTIANWSAGHIPTINEVVYLPKAVTVDIAGAKAKRVRIQRDGESYTGKLTISATGGLVVAEDIKAQHEADGAYEATTKEDLRIETSYEGNGGLITGNACEGNNAEYEFYTKAYKYSYETYKFYINQYIGIPFVSMEAYKLYGFNIFVYDDGADDWRTPGSTTMEAWKAYDLIRRYENDDWSYFNLDGELNLPGKSATKTFTCSWRGTDGSIDETAGHEDYLFANSWTAPISIKDITASNCSGTSGTDLVQTIYIFNAGYEGAGQKSVGEYAGQWSSFPLASSSYMANAVIPATQAFMVTSKKGSTGATLTLNYNDHVYKPAIDANQINTYPTRAPRRTQANEDPNVLRIIVRSSDVDADQLYVFERGDFTFDFDDSWDGNKILGESFAPQLYALSGSNKMAVNAVPDMEGMKIGFKAGKYDNQYTFSFEYADDAETLYLYDTDTQEYTQISSEATYSFTTSDTKEHERFVITRSKAPQIVTGVDGVVSASDARKQMINGTLYIIRDGRMYNAEGALVK